MKRLLFFMLLLIPIGIGACGQVPFKSVCVKGDGLSRCMQSLSIDLHDSYYFLLGGVNRLFAHHIPTLSANDSCIDLHSYEVRGWDKVGYTAQNDPVVIKNQYLPHTIPMSPCTDSYNSQCIYQ